MLLNFPLDCCHTRVIEKVVLGFGHLVQIHDSCSKASVVVKVMLHDSMEVTNDVLVTVRDDLAARSFTVVVVCLSSDWIVPIGDEMPPPEEEFAHPLPPLGSRWMGAAQTGPSREGSGGASPLHIRFGSVGGSNQANAAGTLVRSVSPAPVHRTEQIVEPFQPPVGIETESVSPVLPTVSENGANLSAHLNNLILLLTQLLMLLCKRLLC